MCMLNCKSFSRNDYSHLSKRCQYAVVLIKCATVRLGIQNNNGPIIVKHDHSTQKLYLDKTYMDNMTLQN